MATLSKIRYANNRKKMTLRESTEYREEAERRRTKPRTFLQNAFEAIESDLSGLYQTGLGGFYHAQRRRDRAQS